MRNFYYMDFKEYEIIKSQKIDHIRVYNYYNDVKCVIPIKLEEGFYFIKFFMSEILKDDFLEEIKAATLAKSLSKAQKLALDRFNNYNIFTSNFIENIVSKNTSIIPLVKWIGERALKSKDIHKDKSLKESIINFLFLNMLYSEEFLTLNDRFIDQNSDKIKIKHLKALHALNVFEFSGELDKKRRLADTLKAKVKKNYNFAILREFSTKLVLRSSSSLSEENKKDIDMKYNHFKLVRDNLLWAFFKVSKRADVEKIFEASEFVENMLGIFRILEDSRNSILHYTFKRINGAILTTLGLTNLNLKVKYNFVIPKQSCCEVTTDVVPKSPESDIMLRKIDSNRTRFKICFINN